MQPRESPRLVRFGVFEFDPASGDLWKAGRRIRLQKQPRQVLTLLLSRPGQLVTREEMRRDLWPDDTFVDFDNSLNVAIRKIRDALGDVAPSPRFVETERAHGYRFIAPLTETPATVPEEPGAARASEPSARLTARVVLAACAAVAMSVLWLAGMPGSRRADVQDASGPITIAVLPFSGVAAGEPDDFLAVGIPDAIITRLSNVGRFRVRPTSAVARYHGKEIDAQQAGRRLDSHYVLAGTIRATSARVRVSVQLVRTADGALVWGDQFDVGRRDLFGVEDDIADEISRALRVQMSETERERLYRRHTQSGAAYERYLMGRARLRALTEEGTLQAIAEFEAARDLDRSYALAYSGLATAAAQIRVRFSSASDAGRWDERARGDARRALELDPDLAEAHEALAAVHRFQEYDWHTVISESRRALALNPGLDRPHLYLAVAYFHIGLLEEAGRELQAARELNPENRVELQEISGATSLFAGRIDEAAGQLSQAHDLTDSRIVKYLFGWTLYYQGEPRRAEALLSMLAGETGPLAGNARATLAAIRAARGAHADARVLAAGAASDPDLIHHGAYGLATAYAQLGDPAAALRWLSRAATTGFPCYPWYERDPLLDPLRDDPRFAHFMRELRRSWDDARAKYAGGAVTF